MRITQRILVTGTAALLTFTTVAHATAPASLAGKAVFLSIQNGSGPFDPGTGLAVAPAASGSGFTIVGAGSAPLTGSYTYDGAGTMMLNVSGAGEYQLNLQFTSATQGSFTLGGTQGSASGQFWYYSVPVPTSMQNAELDMSPYLDGMIAKVVTSASGSSYTATDAGGTPQSTGTYSYSRVNPCLGKIIIHDSVNGTGTGYFGFYQGNHGMFGLEGSSATEVVNCTLIDHQAPTVAITSPAANARLLDLPVQVTGTATDNSSIVAVRYTVQNINGISGVLTADGTTSWSASIPAPAPGTNLITVTAIDADGNVSTPVSRVFTYVASSALTIQSTDGGTFTPSLNGQFLEIGKPYTITAKPSTGYIFAGWSGAYSSTAAALTFTMSSNLVLQATFVPNPFPAVAGTYNGMFPSYDTNSVSFSARAAGAQPQPQDLLSAAPDTIGSLSLSVTAKGTYSGKVKLGIATYSISGQFNADGFATKTIVTKTGTTLTLSLALDLTDKTVLAGSIGDGVNWINNLTAARCTYSTKNASPLGGYAYTFILPTALDLQDTNAPTGHAYGTVSISPAGAVKVAGSLPDGTPFTQSSTLAQDNSWPMCLQLYKGAGLFAGWITCATNELAGYTRWVRPADTKAKYYPKGLDFQSAVVSSRYVATATPFLDFTTGIAVFSDGNLAQDFMNQIELVAGPKVVNHSNNKLTLTFTKPSGLFSGSVNPPGVSRSIPFKGVVLQNLNLGAGYFLGTNAPGSVMLGQGL